MPRGNPSPKLAITIDPEVREQRRAGLAAITQWEKQHGPFSAEEMAEARRRVRAQLRRARTVGHRA
jgi:hypothetical protein